MYVAHTHTHTPKDPKDYGDANVCMWHTHTHTHTHTPKDLKDTKDIKDTIKVAWVNGQGHFTVAMCY